MYTIRYFFKRLRLSYIMFIEYNKIESNKSQYRLKQSIVHFKKIQSVLNSVQKCKYYDLQLQCCSNMITNFNRQFPKEYSFSKLLENLLNSKKLELLTV